jgi:nucleotide-binding universal stress UspA family protein
VKAFWRSQFTGVESQGTNPLIQAQVTVNQATRSASGQEAGPIVVGIDGRPAGWKALEWAAAEAASRGSTLRIVHTVELPPPTLDMFGSFTVDQWDPTVQQKGELILSEAVDLARLVAPDVQVSSQLLVGETAGGILRDSNRDALIVIGRTHCAGGRVPFARSIGRRVVSRAKCPVAIVELFPEGLKGPSVGRVVVSVGCSWGAETVLAFAFEAAQRRKLGISVVHPWTLRCTASSPDPFGAKVIECPSIKSTLRRFEEKYPDVEVRQARVAGPPGPAIASESLGAALIVLGASGRLSRSMLGALESIQSPVAIVRMAAGKR